jgi:hypothetical protein
VAWLPATRKTKEAGSSRRKTRVGIEGPTLASDKCGVVLGEVEPVKPESLETSRLYGLGGRSNGGACSTEFSGLGGADPSGIDEDLSFYEGAGAGPDMAKVKEAINAQSMRISIR